MKNHLPRSCFISYAYKDIDVRELLLQKLPAQLTPFLFPPINVMPNQMVSNELVKALLACEALIYLKGGYSATSFWVAFERDYALRSGKPVFSFDPQTLTISPDNSLPLRLAIIANYSTKDNKAFQEIANFMKRERFINVWSIYDIEGGSEWENVINSNLDQRLAVGIDLIFWSRGFVMDRLTSGVQYELHQYLSRYKRLPTVLFVLLDNTPMRPEWPSSYVSPSIDLGIPSREYTLQAWRYNLPSLYSSFQEGVKFYRESQYSKLHHIDDLIVRLYWLIYQNTQQNSLE